MNTVTLLLTTLRIPSPMQAATGKPNLTVVDCSKKPIEITVNQITYDNIYLTAIAYAN